MSKALDAYEDGPVGALRRYLARPDAVKADSIGDPVKTARAIIESATSADPPRRIPLGSDAHTAIEDALAGRIAEHRTQRALAHSTDR